MKQSLRDDTALLGHAPIFTELVFVVKTDLYRVLGHSSANVKYACYLFLAIFLCSLLHIFRYGFANLKLR